MTHIEQIQSAFTDLQTAQTAVSEVASKTFTIGNEEEIITVVMTFTATGVIIQFDFGEAQTSITLNYTQLNDLKTNIDGLYCEIIEEA